MIGLKYLLISFSIVLMCNIFEKENNYLQLRVRSNPNTKLKFCKTVELENKILKNLEFRIRKQIFLIRI